MKSDSTNTCCRLLALPLLALLISTGNTSGEILDTLAEYGNAANATSPNPAGNAHGADFTNAATGSYIITAAGTDIWGGSDHGSVIYDADGKRAAGSNFSAVVRSVSIAADPAEPLANNWGRTGLIARQDVSAANSPNVAHLRRDGANAWTSLQGRRDAGGGTDRANGELGNQVANNANGSVRNTPLWLGLHRVDGEWYATWAADNDGTPGTWSIPRQRDTPGNNMNGEVWVGLAHQSHGGNNAHNLGGNTAVFENFSVSDFGTFTSGGSGSLSLDGDNVLLSTDAFKLGEDLEATEWRVDYLTAVPINTITPGKLRADIYMQNNGGNLGAFNAMTEGPANGTTFIENILWSSNNYTQTNAEGVNLFALAVPGSFTGGQDQYGINMTGQIHIPGDADRDGKETIQFHDGNDDYALLVVDGVTIIDHNGWSDVNGHNGTLGSFDCSDPKFDDGEWVTFRFGMWEGGGGDNASIAWDALDLTGSDSVTGGTDGSLNSWNPNNITIGANGNVPHGGDRVPSANFRVLSPNFIETSQSGEGSVDDLLLDNPVTATTTALKLYANGTLVSTLDLLPAISSNSFTDYTEVTVVIADGAASTLDESTVSATDSSGNTLEATVTRDGPNVIVVINVGEVEPLSIYPLNVSGTTTGDAPVDLNASQQAFPLYAEMRAGLETPTNSTVGWDVMEWTGRTGYIGGINAIRNDVPSATATVPFINFTDPQSNATAGDWNVDDRPVLTNTPADDNNYVTFARTTWSATAGDYTIRVRGDDGYGLRIPGVNFSAVKGATQNTLGTDGSTSYFTEGTGNSNAWIQINVPEDGDYLVEFFAFEGGGGSNQEILINTGHHDNFNANGWELFGNMGEYNAASRWGEIPSSVLPYLAQDGTDEEGWHAKIWYSAMNGAGQEVNNLDQTMRFLRDLEAETSTFGGSWDGFLGALNHSENGDNRGRINPTEPYPRPEPGDGDFRNDRIAMVAHARLVVPEDGDYTVQIRSDDGFLMRFLDPDNTFHTESGNGKIEMLYPSEISHENGTGDSNTRAAAYLTAGSHDIAFVWWEGGGGDHFEVSMVNGVEMDQNAAFVLLDTSFTGKGPNLDDDGDGLSDPWEIANFGNLDQDETGDPDNDESTNAQEFAAGSDPNKADTDGDGLNDGAEAVAATDPTNADTDGDGLQDGAEIATHNTDPTAPDSDGDGFSDGDEIISGTNPNNSNSSPSLAVPLAYWPFDDQDPATTEDITGKHPGTLNGNPTYVAGHTAEAGDFAIQFDGVDDFVGSGAQLLNLKDGFTMSGWVNFTVSQANRTGLFGQNDLVEFGMSNATTMQLWTPRAGAVNIAFGPSSEGWRHIAVTGDNLRQVIYIDGVEAGSGGAPAPLANNGSSFNIGGGGIYDAANNWFNGQIDDVAVWDVVMTAETITALADGTLTPLGAKDETPLEITSVEYNPVTNQVTLTWSSSPNVFYSVDQSPDLMNWDLEIDDSVQSTGETTSFTFPPINAPDKAFFRVRVSE